MRIGIWLMKKHGKSVPSMTTCPDAQRRSVVQGKPCLTYSSIERLDILWKLDESPRVSGWWFGTFFIFPYIRDVIIPIDFHIFQRGLFNHQPALLWFLSFWSELGRLLVKRSDWRLSRGLEIQECTAFTILSTVFLPCFTGTFDHNIHSIWSHITW